MNALAHSGAFWVGLIAGLILIYFLPTMIGVTRKVERLGLLFFLNVLPTDAGRFAADIGNAGSGTRATDLTTLQWHTFQDPLDGVRRGLWTRILVVVGWEGAAVLAATQILLQLEWPIRLGRHDVVAGVVKRGHRALDELNALR